jgi:cell division transport system permease protein
MVTAEILPASLEISTTKIDYLSELAAKMKKEANVEEVIYQESLVKSLQTWTKTIREIGSVLLGFLSVYSWLIILIIIGMKVTVRREEIEILKLLGASNWYICWPFVGEGVFYGLLGAILGWGSGYLVLLYSTPLLVNFLEGLPLLPVPFWTMLILLGSELLAGLVIGLTGSLLAVKRYLA